MSELIDQVRALDGELKKHFHKQADGLEALQRQVDSIDTRMQRPSFGGGTSDDIARKLWDSPEFATLRNTGRGQAIVRLADFDVKTLVSSTATGSSTSGVMSIDRRPQITAEARRKLRIRDLLPTIQTTQQIVDFVRCSSASRVVSPQVEASAKGESEYLFESVSAAIKTIATVLPASKQIISDLAGLESFVRGALAYSVEEELEDQILSGDNTAQNLNGLTIQATAFNTALTTASDGWEKSDLVGRAIQQISASNETPATFVVLNPADAWDIRTQKTTAGEYTFGPPNRPGPANLFGLQIVETNSMSAGFFLVGSNAPEASSIVERQGVTVEVSSEHSDYWVRNLLMFRAEARLALLVYRPAAFVYGALNTSPA